MKVTFLGSAAAEGYPALWCRCERCTTARERGGRNLRFRSSLLVNNDLLIDPGPDILNAAIRLGLDLSPVQACLVTHPHSDHLEDTNFYWRRKGFVGTPLPLMRVYASEASITRLLRHDGRAIEAESIRIEVQPIAPFQHFEIATGGTLEPDPRFEGSAGQSLPSRRYRVWTFTASHAEPSMEPMFYAVSQTDGPEVAGRSDQPVLLYATDTGPFATTTWDALDRLASDQIRFTATAIDSTMGVGRAGGSHMNLEQMAEHQAELRRRNLLAPDSSLFAHHFSHNGTPPYEELEAYLSERGIHASYDGLTVAI
ncbi:MAG TPA: MBL fold metallo-hydrolase [Chloroflexota bacterium]|nr:MBL fold metallo-hydrolase [Chloroflexota bacterium]